MAFSTCLFSSLALVALYLELTSPKSISIFLAIKILLFSLSGGAIQCLTTAMLLYLSPGRYDGRCKMASSDSDTDWSRFTGIAGILGVVKHAWREV